MYKKILKPGHNCWRIRRADRVSFLIDGEEYFNALYDALSEARHEIVILSWDIYSDLKLGVMSGDKRPLYQLLDDKLNENELFYVRILNWDFAVLVAMSREWLPMYRLGWNTHPRFEFEMDDHHPTGGSHHQKIVVLDNQLAFTGGLDLTRGRWDTHKHKANDSRRKKVDGTLGRPYHDVQIAVSGDAAEALGDLARERWRRATDDNYKKVKTDSILWPPQLKVDLEEVDVAICRTMPAVGEYEQVNEIEQLYIDSITVAEDYIYIENQFFTSPVINDALIERLLEENGPDIVINLPLETEGWISKNSMDVMRINLIQKLRKADKYQRLAIYFSYKDDLETMPINLHSKVMVCDDRFARVGSSNLNNRSMSLDTECDIAIECKPDDTRVKKGIMAFRDRLLGEHLGCEPDDIKQSIEKHSSLIEAIENRRTNTHRTLMPLEDKLPEYTESVLTEHELVDPGHGLNMESLMYHFIPDKDTKKSARRIVGWVFTLLFLVALAFAWRYTSLAQLLDIEQITVAIDQLYDHSLAPVLLVAGFIIAGTLMVPVTLLIIASVIVFGPWLGAAYALAGSVVTALLSYYMGSKLGRDTIKNLAGGRINRISQQLAKRGTFTVVLLRIVPVAPFTIINLVAGASHIKFHDFFWGSFLGMLPGITAIAILTDRVRSTIADPQADTIALLIAVAVIVLGGSFLLSRRLMQLREKQAN